jgi:hypothetical protein
LVRCGAGGRAAVVLPAVTALTVAAASAPALTDEIGPLAREVRYQQRLYEALPAAIAAAGGRDALLRCGQPWVDPLQVTSVAWQLRLHISQVKSLPTPGAPVQVYQGPLLQTRNRIQDPLSPTPFPFLTWHERGRATAGGATWIVLSSCPQA